MKLITTIEYVDGLNQQINILRKGLKEITGVCVKSRTRPMIAKDTLKEQEIISNKYKKHE